MALLPLSGDESPTIEVVTAPVWAGMVSAGIGNDFGITLDGTPSRAVRRWDHRKDKEVWVPVDVVDVLPTYYTVDDYLEAYPEQEKHREFLTRTTRKPDVLRWAMVQTLANSCYPDGYYELWVYDDKRDRSTSTVLNDGDDGYWVKHSWDPPKKFEAFDDIVNLGPCFPRDWGLFGFRPD